MAWDVATECYQRLHDAGWSIGDVRQGDVWIVSGTNGLRELRATGVTQTEAWRKALSDAEGVVFVGR